MIGTPTHNSFDIAPPIDPATLGYVNADYGNSHAFTPALMPMPLTP